MPPPDLPFHANNRLVTLAEFGEVFSVDARTVERRLIANGVAPAETSLDASGALVSRYRLIDVLEGITDG